MTVGILAEVACVVGLLWWRDIFDRLHFVAAATTVGPVLVGSAVCLAGMSTASALTQSLAALALLVVFNPVLTHATGRAVHRRRGGRAAAEERS